MINTHQIFLITSIFFLLSVYTTISTYNTFDSTAFVKDHTNYVLRSQDDVLTQLNEYEYQPSETDYDRTPTNKNLLVKSLDGLKVLMAALLPLVIIVPQNSLQQVLLIVMQSINGFFAFSLGILLWDKIVKSKVD